MSGEKMEYSKSNMPIGGGRPAPQPEAINDPTCGPIGGPDSDSVLYPSLETQGLGLIKIPKRDAATSMEKIESYKLLELPRVIGDRVTATLGTPDASLEFSFFTGALAGAEVLSPHAQKHMNELAKTFAAIQPGEHQADFYEREIEPWLATLRAGQR